MPDASLYPFEILIPGTPVSMQSRNRPRLHAYKDDVQTLARARRMQTFPTGPTDDVPVAATIYYFSGDALSGDVDNIVLGRDVAADDVDFMLAAIDRAIGSAFAV